VSALPEDRTELTNIELVSDVFAAFNRRDLDAAIAVCHPDVEFFAPTAEMANAGEPYRGHDGMRKYYEDVSRVWLELEVLPREYRDADDSTVLVFGRVYGRGEGGYIQDSPAQWVMRIRDGLVWSIRVFTNRSAALAEAGVPE
jgi:ketosteroid isomerase-like protein